MNEELIIALAEVYRFIKSGKKLDCWQENFYHEPFYLIGQECENCRNENDSSLACNEGDGCKFISCFEIDSNLILNSEFMTSENGKTIVDRYKMDRLIDFFNGKESEEFAELKIQLERYYKLLEFA